MSELWHNFETWASQYPDFWLWLGAISVLLFVISILTLPWLLSQIPVDYFTKPKPTLSTRDFTPTRLIVFFIRNTIGILLIFLGILMLVLPGQGLITIIAGIILVNFPGKFAFEKWLIRRKGVYKMINWLRAKRSQPPLQKP